MPRPPRDLNPDSLISAYGAELRARRVAAGLSQVKAAEAIGYSHQWIGKVELGEKQPSKAFAEDCDTFFQTGGTFYRLWDAINRAGSGPKVPPGFRKYARLEAEATAIRKFDALLIPGLLQNEAYAREVLRPGQPIEGELEQLVAHRLERQKILDRGNPPHLWAVLDEIVLRRRLAPADITRNQLKHLIEMTERPNVHLEIVPFDTGGYGGLEGSFTVLALGKESGVAYVEAGGHGQVFEDPDTVASFALRFDVIRGEALPSKESRRLISSIMEAL